MKIRYKIEGLDCPSCTAKLEKQLAAGEGVLSAKINFLTEKITVETDAPSDSLDSFVMQTAKNFHKGITVTKL